MAGSETNQLSQVFLLTTVHTTCCHSFLSHESFIGGLVGVAGSETNQLSQVFLLTTVHTTCCHSFSSHESFIGGLVGVA